MYESYKEPLITRRAFLLRVAWHGLIVLGALILWVAVGVVGYAGLAHLSLVDAFLNAAMIAGGMGPVDILQNDAAKVFAGVYAIVSGTILLVGAGVVLAPILHRLLHTLHLDDIDDDDDDTSSS